MEHVRKQKLIKHPMEEVLDIEPNTTLVEYKEAVPATIVTPPDYDDKDCEIEQKLEEIYTTAMGQATLIAEQTECVEGKYKARMGEVTATMLNVALGAVKERRELKKHKDGLQSKAVAPGTVNNNLVVADRNDLLRMLANKDMPK